MKEREKGRRKRRGIKVRGKGTNELIRILGGDRLVSLGKKELLQTFNNFVATHKVWRERREEE
jgi:hypothetical protein